MGLVFRSGLARRAGSGPVWGLQSRCDWASVGKRIWRSDWAWRIRPRGGSRRWRLLAGFPISSPPGIPLRMWECLRDTVIGFFQNRRLKKARWKPQCLLWLKKKSLTIIPVTFYLSEASHQVQSIFKRMETGLHLLQQVLLKYLWLYFKITTCGERRWSGESGERRWSEERKGASQVF